MKKYEECMPAIDDRPMTKERAEKMYQRWITRKSDMEPLCEEKIPGINDAATKEELKKMADALMSQESDMKQSPVDRLLPVIDDRPKSREEILAMWEELIKKNDDGTPRTGA